VYKRQHFARNNDLELINLGKGGAGNEYITTNLIQYSKLNKDIADNAIFGIQLSECLRTLVCLDFPDTYGYPKYHHITPAQFVREDGFSGWDLNIHHNEFIYKNRYALAPFFMNITNSVLITINAIIGFIDFCEANNYPYFIFDGLTGNIPQKIDGNWILQNKTWKEEIWEVLVKETDDDYLFFHNEGKPIIHSKIVDYVNSIKNYIQDDTIKYHLEILGKTQYDDSDYYMKGNQGHPNEEGAKIWAEYLQNKIEEIFVKMD
jgi:hypothetical protein